MTSFLDESNTVACRASKSSRNSGPETVARRRVRLSAFGALRLQPALAHAEIVCQMMGSLFLKFFDSCLAKLRSNMARQRLFGQKSGSFPKRYAMPLDTTTPTRSPETVLSQPPGGTLRLHPRIPGKRGLALVKTAWVQETSFF